MITVLVLAVVGVDKIDLSVYSYKAALQEMLLGDRYQFNAQMFVVSFE